MNLVTLVRDVFIAKRIDEQIIYAEALREIESGVRRDGLWAKAVASSNGDEPKAKSAYICLVAAAIRDDQYLLRRVAQDQALKLEREQREERCAREVQGRQNEQRVYEAQGARAKRIGWLFVLPGWILGTFGFQLAGTELWFALCMSAVVVAPSSGLIAFLVASFAYRGVRL
ncbi:MAG TPA: hypothetical protein PLE54_04865 [Burkholderiaceae bacterium]|nr:hypothetical protein [Burkholderiaceae bacterium]